MEGMNYQGVQVVAVRACVHTVAVVTRVPSRAAASVCISSLVQNWPAVLHWSLCPSPQNNI